MHESALKRDRGPHRPSGSHWYWILSSGAIFRAGIKACVVTTVEILTDRICGPSKVWRRGERRSGENRVS